MVPTFLVFGVASQVTIHPDDLQAQRKLLIALHGTRNKMVKLIGKSRLSTALHRHGTSATDKDIKIGETLIVFCNSFSRLEALFGVGNTDEMIVKLGQIGCLILYSIDNVKDYNMSKMHKT